jgi:hypothetical protein
MRRLIWIAALVLAVQAPAPAQNKQGGRGIALEESYLQESIDSMLIREQSRSDSRDVKESALATIEASLRRGTRNEDIRGALESMGLEGTLNRSIEQGRVRNNFPDIRRKTARCLGLMGGEEAYAILMRMLGAETQAFVLAEVVEALALVGINPNNEAVRLITARAARFDAGLPDNLLAFAVLRAYERFASENKWRLDPDSEALLANISSGRYHAAARAGARDLLFKLRGY